MNIIFQAALFFGLYILSDTLSFLLPFPFPGSVIAMIILFILLITKAVRVDKISSLSEFLLDNMAFFFIPPTIGIINYVDILKNIWWQFILICCITTLLTFFATAYTVKGVMYLLNRRREKND